MSANSVHEIAERLLASRRALLDASVRRHYQRLHEIPELAFAERQTADYLAAELRSLGLSPRTGVGGTGLVVELPGGGEGPTIMLRSDMDGLPIEEAPDHTPRSKHAGCMHACGHDGHMAIGLGIADALARGLGEQDLLPGRIVLLFQPAEELGGGAEGVIEEGILDEYGVDIILGLHLWSFAPLGQAIIPDTTVMASADEFEVVFTGPGGHGALPHRSPDVILALSHFVTSVQSLVSREIDPVLPAVVTVGHIEAGRAANVIPQKAKGYGTFRAANNQVRGLLLHRIGEVAQAIALAHGVEVEVDFGSGYPPTVNDPAVAAVFREIAAEVLPPGGVQAGPPAMASEDFAFYLQERPGAFCLLGMRDEESGAIHPHHSPHFRVSEQALPLGLEILLRSALRLMVEKTR